MAKEKIILAYSGGLDTSIIIPWLKENYDYEVIAVAGDVGQGEELDPLHEKAIKTGASKLYIADIKDEFVNDFIFPTLKAGAVYEKKYLLGTAFARPVIAKALVDIAKKEGAVAICHGATGKGNDQVRFELTIKALAPELKIIAPWRIWDIKSRSEAIDYAKERNIDIPVTKKHSYSMDKNLWHLSHEGADLEDPWNEPKDEMLTVCNTPEQASNKAEYIEIDFEKGIPIAVDGIKMDGVALIEKLNKILGDEKEIIKIIKRDLSELKEKYGDNRRTKIVGSVKEFEEKDMVDKKQVVVTITEKGYIKRIDLKQYKEQRRGGKGVIGSELTSEDFVKDLLTCSTHDFMLFFTDKGKVHWLKAYEIPSSAKSSKGKAIINLLALKDEKVTSVLAVNEFKDYLMMATKKGVVKKIELSQFANPRKGGIKAIKVVETEDTLIEVKPVKASQEILLVTKKGQAIRFNSDEVRAMGRGSYGVTGIKLNKDDKVVSLEVLPLQNSKESSVLTITNKGYGKRTEIEDYRLTGRAGKGVINMKVTDKTGNVVKSQSVTNIDNIIVMTHKGIVIRTPLKNIRVMGRATQGVRVIKLQDTDKVTDLIRVPREEIIDEVVEED